MREIYSHFKSAWKGVNYLNLYITARGTKLSVDSTLSPPIISTIKALKAKRNWIWKGEYYNMPGEPTTLELFMYTFEGTKVIVRVNHSGESRLVYPRGEVLFYVC